MAQIVQSRCGKSHLFPRSSTNTKSSFLYRGPFRRRFWFCRTRCARSASSARALRGTVRTRPVFVPLNSRPAIGSITLARLRRPHVTDVMLRAKGSGLSPKSVRHVRNLLHAALEWAVEEGLCATNVAHARIRHRRKGVKAPTPVRAIIEAQAKRLLGAAVDTPWHAFFTLAFAPAAPRRAGSVAVGERRLRAQVDHDQ